MMVDGPGRSKFGHGRNCWQWVKHAWLYFDLLQALKGDHLSGLASQQGSGGQVGGGGGLHLHFQTAGRAKVLDQIKRQQADKWNQMTALGFQTGGRQTSQPLLTTSLYRILKSNKLNQHNMGITPPMYNKGNKSWNGYNCS